MNHSKKFCEKVLGVLLSLPSLLFSSLTPPYFSSFAAKGVPWDATPGEEKEKPEQAEYGRILNIAPALVVAYAPVVSQRWLLFRFRPKRRWGCVFVVLRVSKSPK